METYDFNNKQLCDNNYKFNNREVNYKYWSPCYTLQKTLRNIMKMLIHF